MLLALRAHRVGAHRIGEQIDRASSARVDRIDEVAVEAVADLEHDAAGAAAHDGSALPERLAHGQAEALPNRLLDGDVGDALERVDLHVADLMEVRQCVDVGIAGALLLHLLPDAEAFGVVGGHGAGEQQLRVRDLHPHGAKRSDDADRVLPGVVPAHLAHDGATHVEPVLTAQLLGEWDFVVAHDPQPVAFRSFLRDSEVGSPRTKWIWRCHIDLTDANPAVWEFFRPYVELYDASVWTMKKAVPDSLSMDRVVEGHPSIDPLSVKNLEMPLPFAEELCRQYGLDVRRPIVCQVSRYDPWKDPVGVIRAFRAVREKVTDAQLLLAGSMATDDPEGFRVWEEVQQERAGDPDIYTLSNLHQVGNVQINAFQRVADVVIQKSVREGFGLTVSEALWKARPVVGGRAGGIVLQLRDGFDGYLVDSVDECAARTMDLLADPVGADAMGAQGKEHVRGGFLSTRELEDWLRLLTELRA